MSKPLLSSTNEISYLIAFSSFIIASNSVFGTGTAPATFSFLLAIASKPPSNGFDSILRLGDLSRAHIVALQLIITRDLSNQSKLDPRSTSNFPSNAEVHDCGLKIIQIFHLQKTFHALGIDSVWYDASVNSEIDRWGWCLLEHAVAGSNFEILIWYDYFFLQTRNGKRMEKEK